MGGMTFRPGENEVDEETFGALLEEVARQPDGVAAHQLQRSLFWTHPVAVAAPHGVNSCEVPVGATIGGIVGPALIVGAGGASVAEELAAPEDEALPDAVEAAEEPPVDDALAVDEDAELALIDTIQGMTIKEAVPLVESMQSVPALTLLAETDRRKGIDSAAADRIKALSEGAE